MQVCTVSRDAAARVVAAALAFCPDVRVTDQSGSEPWFVVEYDSATMDDEEIAQVANAANDAPEVLERLEELLEYSDALRGSDVHKRCARAAADARATCGALRPTPERDAGQQFADAQRRYHAALSASDDACTAMHEAYAKLPRA